MYRFIESIRYENGSMPLLSLHQRRFEQTQLAAFGSVVHQPLEEIILREMPGFLPEPGIKYKCRVTYSIEEIVVTFEKYEQKNISRLKIKIDDKIDYSYKFEDRSKISRHLANTGRDEDIIIVKNNLLTDSSFTNIALFDGLRWFTPAHALLEGVQRAHLLETKKIFPVDIRIKDLPTFEKIKLFNALVNWEEAWELGTENIRL